MSEDEEKKPEPGPAPEEEDSDIVLDTLWNRALEAWDDDKPHHAVFEYAMKAQKVPDLAGRYRALKDDPDKGERAKKIDGIVVAVTQMMMAQKTPLRTKTPWQWTLSVAIASAVVCGWLFYKLFVHH